MSIDEVVKPAQQAHNGINSRPSYNLGSTNQARTVYDIYYSMSENRKKMEGGEMD